MDVDESNDVQQTEEESAVDTAQSMESTVDMNEESQKGPAAEGDFAIDLNHASGRVCETAVYGVAH